MSSGSLRPAWHRGSQGSGKGFQPPPTVADTERRSSNAFAALDDEDDDNKNKAAQGASGRSLADLAKSIKKETVVRFTRERLLSMRPASAPEPPSAIQSNCPFRNTTPQDPVCWDTFDSDELWATRKKSETETATTAAAPATRRTSARPAPGGKWQRGVALPPAEQRKSQELWDDPGQTSADFSAFGAMPDDEPFDFDAMAEATRKFEEELHGSRSRASSDASASNEDVHNVKVDPKRPLASIGTTIRAGSGDDVNVFEDFDEPAAEAETIIKGADEDPSATSRLMAMIGVKKDESAGGETATLKSNEPLAAWGTASAANAAGVSLNPWGGPAIVATPAPPESTMQGLDLQALQEQKHQEEVRRMQESEAQRRIAEELARQQQQQQQQQQQAALQQQQLQQQQQQAGVQSQVEIILMERITAILENSWGRSDLVSILSTLHAEDSRVIPLLSNTDALRALVLRHPRRITVRYDPAYGGEMAILLITNAQWQQQEEAEARAQHEQQIRQHKLQEPQQRPLQSAVPPLAVNPDAPWYYSDPQNNIQGPFRGHEMRQWLEAGYFKGDLPISQTPAGPFRPLSLIYPDLLKAFAGSDDDTRAKAALEEQARHDAEVQRLEVESRARADAQAHLLRERQARELSDRAVAEGSKIDAARKNGGNESSAQLKMMLGLPSQIREEQTPAETPPEAAPIKADKKQAGKAPGKNASKQRAATTQAVPTGTAEPSPVPAPAWGNAAQAQPVNRKSMSEIQKEEARAAAIAAMKRESTRASGSGWANVAAARGGSSAWESGAVKSTPAVVLTNPKGGTGASPTAARHQSMPASSAGRTGSSRASGSSTSSADDFGAVMSPSVEKWCKEQMLKLNGTEDLTLVSFCMTLNDPNEIRQYLTAYLGSSPQVNSFANDFINKRGLGSSTQEEWESTATTKKGKKKKSGSGR